MARRESTSDKRVRRRVARGEGSQQSKVQRLPPASSLIDPLRLHPLERMLEGERGRLADAESVLGCLHVALLHAEDGRTKADPNYASAAAIALALIKKTADQLDYAMIRPLLKAVGSTRAQRKSANSRD